MTNLTKIDLPGFYIATVAAALAIASGGSCAATDNVKTWYVNAATGDDDNGGHSPDDAKATISDALSESAAGDTFHIAPGVYSSTTSLTPKDGQHWLGSGWGTVIQKTTGGFGQGAVKLNLISGVTIENLKVQSAVEGGQGLSAYECQACVLRRVWADGILDGARLDGFHLGLIDQCKATSEYDAWVINGRCTTVQNSIGITSGTRTSPGNAMACFKTSITGSANQDTQITYQNCQAYSLRDASNSQPTVGWETDAFGLTLLQTCSALIVSTATTEASQLLGASVFDNGLSMLSGNCLIRAENESEAGALDLKQAESGTLQADPSTSGYLTTSGTITVRLPNKDPGGVGGLAIEP